MDKSFLLASTFISVVECQGFAKAARTLGISPSIITRRINDLEMDINVQLLTRTTRKITITTAGETFYQQAKGLNEQWREIYLSLQNENQLQTQGKISIAASPTSGTHIVRRFLFDFIKQYPKIEVGCFLSFDKIDLHTDQVDFVIGPEHILRDKDAIVARKIDQMQRKIYASPAYLKKFGYPKSIEDLKNHATVAWRKRLDSKLPWNSPVTALSKNVRFTSNSERLALGASIQGLGIIQIPHLTAESYVNDGLLKEIDLELRECHSKCVNGLYYASVQLAHPRF